MMTVQEAAAILQAGWSGPDVLFRGVSTDSRTVAAPDGAVRMCYSGV